MCVCLLYHLFSFFPLAFVLVNDLFSGFSLFLFWKHVRFCFRLFLFVVCTLYFMFTAVSYQMFFHWGF